jgi:hypothetical protein
MGAAEWGEPGKQVDPAFAPRACHAAFFAASP